MKNPLTIVIFGATGDLYQNKLAVALFDLFSLDLLPKDFSVVGFARRPFTDEDFQKITRDAIENNKNKKNKTYDKDKLDKFTSRVKYNQGDLGSLDSFKDLSLKIEEDDASLGVCSNKMYYLAVPPDLYEGIFKNISLSGLTVPCAQGVPDLENAWTRVLVEKPFGKDLEHAEKLDQLLGDLFDESQIFRIDHYLAKENLLEFLRFRFGKNDSSALWHGEYIEKVEIIFHESSDISRRGDFYDGLGALRDVGQNHMLEMFALVAMKEPVSQSAQDFQKARCEILEKVIVVDSPTMLRAQYAGYLDEPKISIGSKTETFFRVELGIEDEDWAGVKFILESGKALNKGEVLIDIYFKDGRGKKSFPVSSDVGIIHDAYEKVLEDAILGDQTVFTSTKEIMAEWKIITKILELWQSKPLVIYKKGARADEIK
jgi:glucose-6-phosphate 1-dehydrogenase